MPEYYNVSDNTVPAVMGRRTLHRRGIVIHTSEGINSLNWLQGGSALHGRPASADYLISRKGDIMQIIPPGYYAYHTGQARHGLYQEPDRTINQGYYGIELENYAKDGQRVTDLQYISLAYLVRILVSYIRIDLRNIIGHYQVALPQGRKQDPSGFDWSTLAVEMINPSPEWKDYLLMEEIP